MILSNGIGSWRGYERGVGASVARCPRTPPDAAKTPGLQIGLSNRITRPEQPEHSCRLQLWIGPITAEPCRAKARPLRPRRSYFAPGSGIRNQEIRKSGVRKIGRLVLIPES